MSKLTSPQGEQEKSVRIVTWYKGVAALIGWFALVLQLVLIINKAGQDATPVSTAVINYFSFFTILTNILVALSYTAQVVAPQSKAGRFFSRPSVKAAITLYILVVGITYSLLLRKLWQPQGAQLVADRLLHDLMPVLATVGWLVFERKGSLQWKNILPWLIYPAVYLIYTMLRGSATGIYPYPFLDLNKLTMQTALINIALMSFAFLMIGLVIICVDKIMAPKS